MHYQRSLLSSSTPRYILDLKTVKSMTEQVKIAQNGLDTYIMARISPDQLSMLDPDAAANEVMSESV